MSLKKYIVEEIKALEVNINSIDNFLKTKCSPLQRAVLLKTKDTLLFVRDTFQDEKSDIVLVDNIYNKLPLVYQKLFMVIKAE